MALRHSHGIGVYLTPCVPRSPFFQKERREICYHTVYGTQRVPFPIITKRGEAGVSKAHSIFIRRYANGYG